MRVASTTEGRDGLETVAFRNRDGSVTALVLNNRSAAATFTLRWQGRMVQATLPARSLGSYTSKPD